MSRGTWLLSISIAWTLALAGLLLVMIVVY